MTAKSDAIVTFKVCPKCKGSGVVPCDGKEYYRQLHREWAASFHLKPVVYNWLGKVVIPGLAVAQLLPGGWYGLKVYVAVTAIPRSGIYEAGYDGYGAYRLDGRRVPRSIMSVQGVDLSYFDIVNDKAFWHLSCPQNRKDELTLLDYWPDILALEDRKLIEEFSNNQRPEAER